MADGLGITLKEQDVKLKFQELIYKTSVSAPVVILIDEYDKPIIDYLDNIPLAEENRTISFIRY